LKLIIFKTIFSVYRVRTGQFSKLPVEKSKTEDIEEVFLMKVTMLAPSFFDNEEVQEKLETILAHFGKQHDVTIQLLGEVNKTLMTVNTTLL
jgi:hypothetical protein